MNMIFSEASGLNDTIFGKVQAPVRLFLEQRAEAYEKKSMLGEFFTMGKSDNFGDMLTGLTAMDDFKPGVENGSYPATSTQEGYRKLIEYPEWRNSFAISKKLIEDGKLMDLNKKPGAFIKAYNRTREGFGAALFGGAICRKTTVTFNGMKFDVTGADGVPLFHTAHKPKVKGATQSNLFSNEFSADALDRAEAAMQQFKGDNGELLGVAPTTIAIANIPALKRKVFAAIGADQDPDTANNGFNFQYGRWNVKIWNYLNQFLGDDAEPWMLLDDDYNEEMGGAVWNDRVPLTVESYINQDNDANVWKGRARFNACFNDFRFACLGGVAGGTDLTTLKI